MPAAAFGLALLWVAAQTAPWTPVEWRNPAYAAIGAPGAISVHPERTAQFGLRLLGYGAVFWLAVRLGRDPRVAGRGMAAVAASAAALAIWSVGRMLWLGDAGERIAGTFLNRNAFATYAGFGALICAAFLMGAAQRALSAEELEPRDAVRRLLRAFPGRGAGPLAGFLLCFTGLLMTGSRAGVAASLAGFATLAGLRALVREGRGRARSGALLAGLALFGFWVAGDLVLERWIATDTSAEARTRLFSSLSVAIGDHGALGVGLGGFWEGFRPYKDAALGRATWDFGHNSWLETVFELGWGGGACLFLALGAVVWACARGVARRRRDRMHPILGVSISVLAVLHAAFDVSLQTPAVATAYALILGLAFAQSWPTRPSGEMRSP